MPIEIRELHIRVVVQDTSEATLPGGALAAEGDTSQYPDHKNWIDVTAVNIGGHKPGGGAAGDDAPTEEVSFAYARAAVQHTEGDFLFPADADATGMLRAVAQDDPFDHGDGSVRFIRDSIDGGVWTGGGRDILIGGAGADHIEATNNRGHLLVGVDDVHLKVFDGFDLA